MAYRFPNRTAQTGIYHTGASDYVALAAGSALDGRVLFSTKAVDDSWDDGDLLPVEVRIDDDNWVVGIGTWDETNEYLILDTVEDTSGTLVDTAQVEVTAVITQDSLEARFIEIRDYQSATQDPYWNSVTLLLQIYDKSGAGTPPGNSSVIADRSPNPKPLRTEGSVLTENSGHYNDSSCYYIAEGAYIWGDNQTLLSTRPWTIETWIYLDSDLPDTSEHGCIFCAQAYVDGAWYTVFKLVVEDDGTMTVYALDGHPHESVTYTTDTTTAALTQDQWFHVALVNDHPNGDFFLYLNGTKAQTTGVWDVTRWYDWGMARWYIGYDPDNPTYDFSATIRIEDFRVTNGVARYTAADESSNIPAAKVPDS